jgi:hypothetical protein
MSASKVHSSASSTLSARVTICCAPGRAARDWRTTGRRLIAGVVFLGVFTLLLIGKGTKDVDIDRQE